MRQTTADFIRDRRALGNASRNITIDGRPAEVLAELGTGVLVVVYHDAEFKTYHQADEVHDFELDGPTRYEHQTALAEAGARRLGLRI